MATRSTGDVGPGCAHRAAPAPQPLRDLPDGSPAAPGALPGELMALSTRPTSRGRVVGKVRPLLLIGAAWALSVGLSGCAWDSWHLVPTTPPPAGPADTLTLRGDKLEADATPAQ